MENKQLKEEDNWYRECVCISIKNLTAQYNSLALLLKDLLKTQGYQKLAKLCNGDDILLLNMDDSVKIDNVKDENIRSLLISARQMMITIIKLKKWNQISEDDLEIEIID